MKRFLPLLMLTGLLFGQDILNLKSGESFEGTFHEKLGRDILFKAVGDTTMKKFPIWDVETIVTKNGELTYPFDIPTKELSKQDVLLHKSGENYKGTFIGKVDEDIVFQIEGRSSTNKFPINDVDIVITSRGGIKVELYYPFDIPIKKENPSFGQDTTILLENGGTLKGTIVSETDSTYRIMGESWRVTDGIYEVINTFINISKNETVEEKELFSQDGLFLKSGEFYKGRYVKKVDELIVFQVEGENHFTPFPINDVVVALNKKQRRKE